MCDIKMDEKKTYEEEPALWRDLCGQNPWKTIEDLRKANRTKDMQIKNFEIQIDSLESKNREVTKEVQNLRLLHENCRCGSCYIEISSAV